MRSPDDDLVGYWGLRLVGRIDGALSTLPQVAIFGSPEEERQLGLGWSELGLRLTGPEPDLPTAVRSIVGATRAPALAAFILDSDCAVVEAMAPSGQRWSAVLNAELAASYPPIAEGHDPKPVVPRAIEWSREAGLNPSEPRLRAALYEKRVVAEELWESLLAGLGLTKG